MPNSKPYKYTDFERSISLEIENDIRNELKKRRQEALSKVTFTLPVDHFRHLLLLAAEEVKSLQPSAPSPEAREAFLMDEHRRKESNRPSRSYEVFLCSYKASATKRRTLLLGGKVHEADFELEQAVSRLQVLERLNDLLNSRLR